MSNVEKSISIFEKRIDQFAAKSFKSKQQVVVITTNVDSGNKSDETASNINSVISRIIRKTGRRIHYHKPV